jgi:branched-subunit amino acid ABC-type transport system permease component
MAAGLGANIPALFTSIFGVSVALAAVGGVAAGPILGLYPGMDTEILVPAFMSSSSAAWAACAGHSSAAS